MKFLILIYFTFFLHFSNGQVVTFDNVPPLNGTSSSVGGYVFNFTTNQDIVIQNFRGAFSFNFGTNITLWYNPQKVTGQPLSGLPGWVNLGTTTMNGMSNAGNNIVQTIPIPINLPLSAGDTIAVAFQWNGVVYPSTNTNISSFSDGVVTIIADSTCAYSMNSNMTSFSFPRQIHGGVIYHIQGACSNSPFAGNAVSNFSHACAGQDISLSLDSVSNGQLFYQWQLSTNNNTWISIPGATSFTHQTNQVSSRYYRCQVTCGTSTVNSSSVFVETTTSPFPAGTYTINNTQPSLGSNFSSFQHFVNAISCNGISGNIVVNVINTGTPYYEKVVFETSINTDSNKTLTINGNGARIVSYGGATYRATLTLDSLQYITFNNLEIETTGLTHAYAVELRNDTRFITFDSCLFIAPINTTESTSAAFVTSSSPIQNIHITNCIVNGGFFGIYLNGPNSAPWSSNNLIQNNTIKDPFRYGIFAKGQENSNIIDNEITWVQLGVNNAFFGIFCTGHVEGVRIERNKVHDIIFQWHSTIMFIAIHFNAALATQSNPCLVVNNLIYNNYLNGIHNCISIQNGSSHLQFYHNTLAINSLIPGSSIHELSVVNIANSIGEFVFKNNIFYVENLSHSTNRCIRTSGVTPLLTLDYNQYFIANSTSSSAIFSQDITPFTFAQWQMLGNENNGIFGDPMFIDLPLHNLTPTSGFGNNIAQNITQIVPHDYYLNSRSITPDIGAIEFTPTIDDISLLSGQIARGNCLSSNDTIRLEIRNTGGQPIDFTATPLIVNWSISGPVNSNGSIVVNAGILLSTETMTVYTTSGNLSQVGIYVLNAHLVPNTVNLQANNDTLQTVQTEVISLFNLSPDSILVVDMQTVVDLNATSPLLPRVEVFISEICHLKGATIGSPTSGWPVYLLADDYVELTGVPNSDISGYIFESYTAGTQFGLSHILPPGTVFSPNGTLILAIGQLSTSIPSPSNYYYHTGGTTSFEPNIATGHLIKDPQGNILDAVAYGSFSFPVISGVNASDWTGATPISFGSGIRLEGPDLNNSTGWIISDLAPQSPNVLNPGIMAPTAQSVVGFTWMLNGFVVDTLPNTSVGPWSQDGIYTYIASYITTCGVLTDSITITVVLPCDSPSNAMVSSPSCTQLEVVWSSVPNHLSSSLEYGQSGFLQGTGYLASGVNSPLLITGLNVGTAYDIYIVDTCANGHSISTLISSSTLSVPQPNMVATFNQSSTGINSAIVSFDASSSTNFDTLNWDFGDGSSGTGVIVDHTYNVNQSYNVVLTGTNDCGTNIQTYQVDITGIGLDSELIQTVSVYPNPSNGLFSITFWVNTKDDISISTSNTNGQLIDEWSYDSVHGNFRQDYDLRSYPDGVYFVLIRSSQVILQKKIILQK